MNWKYCNSLTEYKRLETVEVQVGKVKLGGNNPIRVQSMTNTNTMDTEATVNQVLTMAESGAEIVRITAPSVKDAENLKNIREELNNRGCDVPLVADIHFTPDAAETAAKLIEKVRINPGNYANKGNRKKIEFSDEEYEEGKNKIREYLESLILVCKENGTALRIGTNHGSLSQRIMSRYGDTPEGMVESCLEVARLCRELDFHNLVFSMKASNVRVMVQSYRLLVNKMIAEEMNYPLHLGVTEAGDGDDARIKSAAGVGALLQDGIGDTLRVSLAEPPEVEPGVGSKIAEYFEDMNGHNKIIELPEPVKNPFEYEKRESFEVSGIGGDNFPIVVTEYCDCREITKKDFEGAGYKWIESKSEWKTKDTAADFICIGENKLDFEPPEDVKILTDAHLWSGQKNYFPVFKLEEFTDDAQKSDDLNFVIIKIEDIDKSEFEKICNVKNIVFIIQTDNRNGAVEQRRFFFELMSRKIKNPVIISRNYENLERENFIIRSAADLGPLLLDGFGDGVIAKTENIETRENETKSNLVTNTLFGILQSARVRISKTEFIACPSCGRTSFDLMEVTQKVRERTDHLKGLKIAVMGCIVNGPGEMADADYGYIGQGNGKVTLYRNREAILRGVPAENAVDKLVEIIKEDGKWIEPVDEETI